VPVGATYPNFTPGGRRLQPPAQLPLIHSNRGRVRVLKKLLIADRYDGLLVACITKWRYSETRAHPDETAASRLDEDCRVTVTAALRHAVFSSVSRR
jgi:hypothetical protein